MHGPLRAMTGARERQYPPPFEGADMETRTRKIEVFSAGCRGCEETIAFVRRMACRSCAVEVIEVRDDTSFQRAQEYGIKKFPAVVIDGKLAECCSHSGVNEQTLRQMGLGQAP
jgi:glutaredoxin 3